MSDTSKWLQKLNAHVHSVIDKHYSDKVGDDVKIALLDTGVARPSKLHIESEDLRDDMRAMNQRIKRGLTLKEGLKPNEDTDGHGTDCAYLLWKVCPYADIYSYKICSSKEEEPDVELVKQALDHAVHEIKVDIIAMTFGWDRASFQLLEILRQASHAGILLFSATMDDGTGIKYPARDEDVIPIDAANSWGQPLLTNPKRGVNWQRYTAVGTDITSVANFRAAPVPPEELQQKEGTPYATAVAAAMAGLILEFAKQPPLCFSPGVLYWLRTKQGMEYILLELFSIVKVDKFRHIDIGTYFQLTGRAVDRLDGGDWTDLGSQRCNIAYHIASALDPYFKYGDTSLLSQMTGAILAGYQRIPPGYDS